MPEAGREFLGRHALLLITAVGAVARLATLGTQDFWFDEHVTVALVQQGPIDLLRTIPTSESNPPLYYLAQAGWERVFGSSEIGIRSLSAVFGIATIPVVYTAAKTLVCRRTGLIAAALTATSPLLLWYSQEARNYELLAFLAALSFLLFVKALDDYGHRWLWGWALVCALALGTHYFAVFFIVPQAAWLLWRRPGPRIDTALPMGAIVAVGIALLPMLATQRGRGDWIESYSLSGRLLDLPQHFLVGYEVPWAALPVIAVAVVGVVAVYAAIRAEDPSKRALAIAGGVVLAALALVMIAVLAGEDFILTRNLIALWPPFAIMLAAALGSRAAGGLGTATAVGLCVIGLGLAIWIPATPAAQRPPYSELAAELGPTAQPRLIVSQSSFSSPLTLALEGSRAATDEDLSASELIVIEPRPTESYAVGTCLWLPTCGGVDVEPPPPFEPPPGFDFQRTGSTASFDYTVFTATRPTAIQRPLEYYTPRVFVQTPQ